MCICRRRCTVATHSSQTQTGQLCARILMPCQEPSDVEEFIHTHTLLACCVRLCYNATWLPCAGERWHTSRLGVILADPWAILLARAACAGLHAVQLNPVLSPCGSRKRPRLFIETLSTNIRPENPSACQCQFPGQRQQCRPQDPWVGPLLGTFGPLLVSGLLDRTTCEGMKGLVRDDTSWSFNLGSFLAARLLVCSSMAVSDGPETDQHAPVEEGLIYRVPTGIRRQAAPCQMPNPACSSRRDIPTQMGRLEKPCNGPTRGLNYV